MTTVENEPYEDEPSISGHDVQALGIQKMDCLRLRASFLYSWISGHRQLDALESSGGR